VKVAVSNADNVNLTVFATAPNNGGRIKCTTLACDMAYSYRPPKDGANEIQNNLYENRENLPRLEKEGTRQDRMIDKKKANRLNGQSKPQRTFTEKPPPEERCPFRIRLLLAAVATSSTRSSLLARHAVGLTLALRRKEGMPLFMHSRGLLVLQPALSESRLVTIFRSRRFDTTRSPLRFKLVKFHHPLLALS
jgi:hypothetical protein